MIESLVPILSKGPCLPLGILSSSLSHAQPICIWTNNYSWRIGRNSDYLIAAFIIDMYAFNY